MKKVIGTRYFYQESKVNVAAIILVGILGIPFVIIPAIGLMPLPFIALGLVLVAVSIISYFTSYKLIKDRTKKLIDKPTIELSSPDTFTAYLFNGKVVDIKLSDIDRIKSTHRTQITPGIGFYNIKTFEDGTIKFILKDKKKISVQYVNKVDAVADILIKLSRNPQAAAELFNTQEPTETEQA